MIPGHRMRTVLSLALLITVAATPVASPFTLTSASFREGGHIPLRYAGNLTQLTPNCVGSNVSPALSWSNPPEGTKSFALIFSDTEGSRGLGTVHWVAYGIRGSRTDIAEGEVSRLSSDYVPGASAFATGYYIGPCAPRGAPHHYIFSLIATDLEPTALQPGLSADELKAALKGHAVGGAGLMALYARP